jgi:hypothetical protein
MNACPTCGSPMAETAINSNYPRYIKVDGKPIRVESVLHHSQIVGYPVKEDGSGEPALTPASPEDAIAALYGEDLPDPAHNALGEARDTAQEAAYQQSEAIELKELVSAGKWAKPSKTAQK